MDYFQGVVTEYLRANRATFVNTECLLQLQPGDSPGKGEHWYCDAVAVNFHESAAYLCEVTYSRTMHALLTRLSAWAARWPELVAAIRRDCGVPAAWKVQPWAFIPQGYDETFKRRLAILTASAPGLVSMPSPLITHLEDVVPWKYRSWDRKLEALDDEA